jgi:hypothetical protein
MKEDQIDQKPIDDRPLASKAQSRSMANPSFYRHRLHHMSRLCPAESDTCPHGQRVKAVIAANLRQLPQGTGVARGEDSAKLRPRETRASPKRVETFP